ncbi:DUF5813 family protein [Halorussus sp. MSC15.2]|uniref:DUF5813 family protein n=1 Tax=Halorussus sp. MSC15.2 TaxID=2283638 RepID=UPI0019681037|nr:DUF5813 family protein [Halorussus sp. MSC15.2]
MTDERVERAFRQHPHFERTGDGEFGTPEKPFENVVTVADADEGSHRYEVVARTPMLDAVVEGETVADVVEDGWFETLELRLEDAHTVANADAAPPEIEREGDEVVATVEFESADPEQAAEDALAIAEFVEGTWVQGIIPGYEYREPAAGLRERAQQNYNENGVEGADGAGGPGSASGSGDAGGPPR